MLLLGLGAAVGYPWFFANFSGYEVGTYTVYKRPNGFKTATVNLSADQTPVRIFLDMTSTAGYYPVLTRTMLTLTASSGGKTVFASTLNFVSTSTQSTNLQTTDMIFRDHAGDLNIKSTGTYIFVVGEGDVEELSMKTVNLVLRANAQDPDPRVQPIGLACLAVGLLALFRSFRRADKELTAQDTASTESSAPEPSAAEKPKWGRDAAD